MKMKVAHKDVKLAFPEPKKKRNWQCWRGEPVQRGIDYFARISVPVVIVAFNIYYWETAFRNGGIEV